MRTAYKVLIGVGIVGGAFALGAIAAGAGSGSSHLAPAAALASSPTPRPESASVPSTAPVSVSSIPASSPSPSPSGGVPTFQTVNIPNGGGGSFGLITLPGAWPAKPAIQTGQDGRVTDTWRHGGLTIQFAYEAWYGANHHVAGGTDAFNPAAGLPPGLGLIGSSRPLGRINARTWPIGGNGQLGVVATNPAMSGAYVVTGGPYTSSTRQALLSILESVRFYGADFQ